ncbi:uncharacterized protein LOC142504123 [Ascaphus truei]|uniref:uncharacterized protein LOC142504123 n=1 Tax=Ascaphus truei TaxID=8439 RepID=UPI003F591C7D
MFGREARLPVDIRLRVSTDGVHNATHFKYVQRLQENLQQAYQQVERSTEKLNAGNKRRYDHKVKHQDIQPGDARSRAPQEGSAEGAAVQGGRRSSATARRAAALGHGTVRQGVKAEGAAAQRNRRQSTALRQHCALDRRQAEKPRSTGRERGGCCSARRQAKFSNRTQGGSPRSRYREAGRQSGGRCSTTQQATVDSPQAALRARQAAGREAALHRKGARRVLQCKAAGEVQQPHAGRQPSVTVPRGRASQRPGRASAKVGRTSTAGTQDTADRRAGRPAKEGRRLPATVTQNRASRHATRPPVADAGGVTVRISPAESAGPRRQRRPTATAVGANVFRRAENPAWFDYVEPASGEGRTKSQPRSLPHGKPQMATAGVTGTANPIPVPTAISRTPVSFNSSATAGVRGAVADPPGSITHCTDGGTAPAGG